MSSAIKKLAILTSGGDAPGMNNAVRAAVLQSKMLGIEPYIVYYGYKGLTENQIFSVEEAGVKVNDFINSGGTMIFSARYPEFKDPEVRAKAKANLDAKGIDALLVIGGDGSYRGAQLLHEIGVRTVALPGTIDNDIASTEYTIGYDTALNTIVDAVDKIRDTARSHHRAMLVETMGHGASDLALYSGIATGAEIIVNNDQKMTEAELIAAIKKEMDKPHKRSVIAIISEFIFEDLNQVAKNVLAQTGIDTRAVVLAHIQRGGNPSARERINATRMATNAVIWLSEGHSGIAIGFKNGKTVYSPILEALQAVGDNKADTAKRTLKYMKLNQSN